MTIDELCHAWRTNNHVTLKLLALCPDDAMEMKPGKGKTIRSNFAHIVLFRRAWIEDNLKAEAEATPKLDWQTATREQIIEALNVSSESMEKCFRKREGLEKPRKQSTLSLFAYCVAHEAHHRSQIEIALRIGGREPEDKVLYDLWNWP